MIFEGSVATYILVLSVVEIAFDLAFGLLYFAFTKDMREDLGQFSEFLKTKGINAQDLYVRASKLIQHHADVKQLSFYEMN